MVDVQSTFNQATTNYTGTQTGTCRPIGKYKQINSKRLRFVNN